MKFGVQISSRRPSVLTDVISGAYKWCGIYQWCL